MKLTLITTIAATAILFAGYTGNSALAQSADAETPEKTESEKANTPEASTPEASTPEARAHKELTTLDQKLSYIIGRNTAEQLKRDNVNLDGKAFLLAVEDIKAGKDNRLSDKEVQETIAEMQRIVGAAQARAQAEQSEANKKEGEAFLKENGSQEGVITLESGLQYKVIKAGEGGPKPKASDTVTVHYEGTLIDGTVFDSSYQRGQPASFPLNGVIPGWTEVVQLMSVGDKWAVAIPSALAYGTQGAGGQIGPDSTLKFDIELIKIGE